MMSSPQGLDWPSSHSPNSDEQLLLLMLDSGGFMPHDSHVLSSVAMHTTLTNVRYHSCSRCSDKLQWAENRQEHQNVSRTLLKMTFMPDTTVPSEERQHE